MPRSSKLKPAFRRERQDKGFSPWAVNVPAPLSPTGKRQQLYYSSRSEAQSECDRLKAQKENFGISLSLLSPSEITEAAKSIQMLKPHGIGLLKAVREYIANHKRQTASVTFFDI